MIDHVGVTASRFDISRSFHDHALAPLGYGMVMDATPEMTGTDSHHAGFGADRKPAFWFGTGDTTLGSLHVALVARSRGEVDVLPAAAIADGARDKGSPGLRPIYPKHDGAFVLDPVGHNIEAVCHSPE